MSVNDTPLEQFAPSHSHASTVPLGAVLAYAFRVCPNPANEQTEALAARIGLPASHVQDWFVRRRVLEAFVKRDTSVSVTDDVAAVLTYFVLNGAAKLTGRQQALADALSCVDQQRPMLPPVESPVAWSFVASYS